MIENFLSFCPRERDDRNFCQRKRGAPASFLTRTETKISKGPGHHSKYNPSSAGLSSRKTSEKHVSAGIVSSPPINDWTEWVYYMYIYIASNEHRASHSYTAPMTYIYPHVFMPDQSRSRGEQHNQVTEHQAGEVDTGDIFLLIFAPLLQRKRRRIPPPSSFVNIAFRYSPSLLLRDRVPAPACL
jgi:hypothetical protein